MSSRIEEIRQRAAEAIRGPWRWFGNTESDQVYLGTPDRGRLLLVSPQVEYEQYVFNHRASEVYAVEEIRERFTVDPKLIASKSYMDMDEAELKALCDVRGLKVEASYPDDGVTDCDYLNAIEEYDEEHNISPRNWWCSRDAQEHLAEFLRGEVTIEEGSRDLYIPDAFAVERELVLTRSLKANAGLKFAGKVPEDAKNGRGEPWDRHVTGGYMLVDYRAIARYEVLDGRTVAEHEAAGGTINGEVRHLYREDIVGLDNPEAEFIAHAREDVDWLLSEVDRLEKIEAAAREYFREFDHLIGPRESHDYPERQDLRKALREEPS